MLPHEPGLRLAVGCSRSGKTYGMRRDVTRASEKIPVLVVDRLCEWVEFPASIAKRVALVSRVESAEKHIAAGKSLIVVQTKDAAGAAADACAWARDRRGVAGVAVPEAHRAWPNGTPLPEAVEDVACAWRHHKVALWADTQRLAKLHKDLTEQASACELRIYAVLGVRDRKVIGEELGGEVLDALNIIRDRFQGGDGERGWYLRLPSGTPYELRRET